MPRDGAGIYSIPVGTDGITDHTIESTKYNGFIHDVEQDLNAPRPIVAGGTGATSAPEALATLQGERATQVVTNFGSHTWQPGSFTSDIAAVNMPVDGHAFGGIVYMTDANWITVEARDRSDPPTAAEGPGKLYVRQRKAGIWGPWVGETDVTDAKVDIAGDTMTGDLIIEKANPFLVLDRTSGSCQVQGKLNDKLRWGVVLGDTEAEAAGDVGSDFRVTRYDNDGAAISSPFVIDRATGLVTFETLFSPIIGTGQLNLGSAGTVDATLSRSGPGDILIEGNLIYRAGGTDVPIADGGTGASTVSGARANLGLDTGDSPTFTGLTLTGNVALGNAAADTVTVNGTATFVGTTVTTTFQGHVDVAGNTTLGNSSLDTLTVNATATFAVAPTFAAGLTSTDVTTPTITNPTGVDIKGTTTNDSAAAGDIGEIIQSNILVGGAVTLATGVAKDITSIALTGGDWDVWAQVIYVPVTNPVTTLIAGLGTVTLTLPAFSDNARIQSILSYAVGTHSAQVGPKRFNVAGGGQNVFLVINNTFAGTCTAYGYLGARRRR